MGSCNVAQKRELIAFVLKYLHPDLLPNAELAQKIKDEDANGLFVTYRPITTLAGDASFLTEREVTDCENWLGKAGINMTVFRNITTGVHQHATRRGIPTSPSRAFTLCSLERDADVAKPSIPDFERLQASWRNLQIHQTTSWVPSHEGGRDSGRDT